MTIDPEFASATDTKLRATLAAFPGEGFAVMDGGHFEDLPALLRSERLFARSLFLDHADIEVEKAGPWLIGLDQSSDAADRVLALTGDKPAAVYWGCGVGEAALYHHLRTLNLARIPAWAAAGGSVPPDDGAGQEYRRVMFRHWDPAVLGAMLPVLDAGQFARFLGPATELAFHAADYGGLRRVVADPAWPRLKPGMITIRSDQIVAFNERRMVPSRRRIAAYLRENAPERTGSLSDEALLAFVDRSEVTARELGVRTERGQGLFAYLQLITRGRAAQSPEVRAFIAEGRGTPDRQVRAALEHAAAWLIARG